MTKAEATVHLSDKWMLKESRREDHGSLADTVCNIYVSKDGWYRLTCYSSHGDSILWKAEPRPQTDPRYKWHNLGQIEHIYDTALAGLV